VRDLQVFSREEAVHRITGLAAAYTDFADRGVVRVRAVADLVLFDPDTVTDRATPQQPEWLSIGIEGVWVFGQRVLVDCCGTGAGK